MKAVMVNPYKEKKNKRAIKSPKLKEWLSVVKKHGGDMVEAAKEWKKKLKATSAVNPGQRAKGLMPEHTRRKVIAGLARRAARELAGKETNPMAKKKKAKKKKKKKALNRLTAAEWSKAFGRATGVTPKMTAGSPGTTGWYRALAKGASKAGATKFQSALAGRKKPKKARRGAGKAWITGIKKAAREAGASAGRRAAMNSMNQVPRTAGFRGLPRGLVRPGAGRFAGSSAMSTYRKNALALNAAPIMGTLASLVTTDAFKNYGLVGAGFVAGGVIPSAIAKLLVKYKVMDVGPGVALGTVLGIAASLGAGVATGAMTGDAEKAQKVAAGGVAGVVGNLVLGYLMPALGLTGLSGLGQDAEAIVERAVEEELRKELRGMGSGSMGEFVTEEVVEKELGQFLTTPEIEEAPTVADLGTEAEVDIEEAAEGFGYME